MLDKLHIILLLTAFLGACGGIDKKAKEQINAPVFSLQGNSGLLFSGVDLYYSSSDIFMYNYEQGIVNGLLYGQSGDPAVRWLNQLPVLFNRTSTRHNYVLFKEHKQDDFRVRKEISADFEKGDPSEVISLDNGHWLVSYFSKGKVSEFDPLTGRQIQELDLRVEGPFHPSAMFKRRIDGISYIFIASQGIEIQPGTYRTIANGKQGIFLIREDKNKLTLINEGNPIAFPKASNPGFYHIDAQYPMIAGLCFAETPACKQAIEYLDIRKAISEPSRAQVLFAGQELSVDGLTMNGTLCDGLKDDELYANVVFTKDKPPFTMGEKYIVSIRKQLGIELKLIHHYAHPDSSGSYLLLADKSINTVFFGDIGENRQPQMNVLHDESKLTIPMSRIPYHGVLIPQ